MITWFPCPSLPEAQIQTVRLMASSIYETWQQGIVVVVFIVMDSAFVLSASIMIPCRHVLQRELDNAAFSDFSGVVWTENIWCIVKTLFLNFRPA